MFCRELIHLKLHGRISYYTNSAKQANCGKFNVAIAWRRSYRYRAAREFHWLRRDENYSSSDD